MHLTQDKINELKIAEHQTWIRENLWCKQHISPKVDITCDECIKLIPLREKCDSSFANSLNFIETLLKEQREELLEKIFNYCKENGKLVWVKTEDIINLIKKDKCYELPNK